MDDMCQKSINMLWIMHMIKSQASLAHVASIAKSQPNIT
jgi:hypothetical protein